MGKAEKGCFPKRVGFRMGKFASLEYIPLDPIGYPMGYIAYGIPWDNPVWDLVEDCPMGSSMESIPCDPIGYPMLGDITVASFDSLNQGYGRLGYMQRTKRVRTDDPKY